MSNHFHLAGYADDLTTAARRAVYNEGIFEAVEGMTLIPDRKSDGFHSWGRD